jgi:hypothetical protein
MRTLLIVVGLVAISCAAFADNTAAVNLTVSKYANIQTAASLADKTGYNYVQYNAQAAADKAAFAITVDGNGGSGSDTVNFAFSDNAPAYIQSSFTPGTLPGNWTLNFNSAGDTPGSQLFVTDTWDNNKLLIIPAKLTVAGIGIATPAGNYAGTLSFTAWPE